MTERDIFIVALQKEDPAERRAYLDEARQWNSRGHFFAAAAEAMRRILVDNARRKQCKKRGGDRVRLDLDQFAAATSERSRV